MICKLSLAIVAMMFGVVAGMTCHKTAPEEFAFFDGEERIDNEPFPCLKGSTTASSNLEVAAPSAMQGPLMCRAILRQTTTTKVKYEKVELGTGIMCKYECKEQPNKYRCRSKPFAEECPCEQKTPMVVIKPISSELGAGALLTGQSDTGGGEQTCHDKEEGFEFPDPIPCIGIRADVTKKRVKYVSGPSRDDCTFDTNTQPETRYTISSPDNVNLQGCVYACKMASPRCTQNTGGKNCKCKSPGLRRQLVPMDGLAVTARLRQKVCTQDCGPCGECIDGICSLIHLAHTMDRCPCGEICPIFDNREDNLGGQLLCKSNTRLQCMSKPQWMGTSGRSYRPGTEYPDLCTSSRVADIADTCGCAEGYSERIGDPHQSNTICKKD